jgi:hypothetical protein
LASYIKGANPLHFSQLLAFSLSAISLRELFLHSDFEKMVAFVSTAVHREWLTVADWANVEWRDRAPLALGNENVFDAFEPVADERTLLRSRRIIALQRW